MPALRQIFGQITSRGTDFADTAPTVRKNLGPNVASQQLLTFTSRGTTRRTHEKEVRSEAIFGARLHEIGSPPCLKGFFAALKKRRKNKSKSPSLRRKLLNTQKPSIRRVFGFCGRAAPRRFGRFAGHPRREASIMALPWSTCAPRLKFLKNGITCRF